jgi:hypothetical protein
LIELLEAQGREIDRLRATASALLEVVVLDPGALTYGLTRRKAIEAAGDLGITLPDA